MNASWVLVLPIGKTIVIWDGEAERYAPRRISERYAQALASETRRALADWRRDAEAAGLTPFYPPVLSEHVWEGKRFGDVQDVKVAGVGPLRGLYLFVQWGAGAWADIQKDLTQHVSIGTLPSYVDAKGRTYAPIVQELSITGAPRLKDIGVIKDHIGLRLSDALNTRSKKMTLEEAVAKIEELMTKVAELETKMVEKADEEMEGEGDMLADGEVTEEEADAMADKIAAKLSDKVADKVIAKMQGLRLGEGGAASGASKALPKDPLARAKAQGLKGGAAITAAFREMAK